jgi:hypothetical protein
MHLEVLNKTTMKTFKEHIIKTSGGYKLVSKKTGRNLGTATTKAGIMKRERQVQYFKHMHEDGEGGMVGGNPVINNVSSGAIAGLGIGKDGEPGIKKNKKGVSSFTSFVKRKSNVAS